MFLDRQPDYLRAQRTTVGAELPAGVFLSSEEERILWKQLTSARPIEDWRDVDLLIVHKIVILEVKVRKIRTKIETAGELILDRYGEPRISPWVHVLRIYEQKLQRLLSFSQLGIDPIRADTQNRHGKAISDYQDSDFPLLAS